MTGYIQPEDMGYFATEAVRLRTELSPDLWCFWNICRLIDADDSDKARVLDVLELGRANNLFPVNIRSIGLL